MSVGGEGNSLHRCRSLTGLDLMVWGTGDGLTWGDADWLPGERGERSRWGVHVVERTRAWCEATVD